MTPFDVFLFINNLFFRIPTRFNQLKSDRWEDESQLLFCKKMDEEITSLNQAPIEYLQALTEAAAGGSDNASNMDVSIS